MMAYPKLSKREIEIIKAVTEYNTNRNVAHALHISVNTVKTHLKHIYKKLDVHSKTEMILKSGVLKNHPNG